ncbi:hypothetical protein MACJ_002514 [Theileria orientalis]|uniref:Uncharacterized protein n=1 Tax=Theileria orientalis TaxID=68886 RepID=A0A976QSE1_THEOR|nr:hypothetical protein MACJ_002514 [Theileria orientalis]
MNNDSKAVTVYMDDDKTKVFKKDGKNEPWNEIYTTTVNPKSVNITDDKETYFCSNRLDNNVRTFTAKKGFMFNDVREDNIHIWTTNNESEYANKVEYSKHSSGALGLTLYLCDGRRKLFVKESGYNCWHDIDLFKVNLKSINIDCEHDCYAFKNVLKNNLRTFTATAGFAFNYVIEYIDDKNRYQIWKANNENEYANKIEVDLMNNDAKAVTIHMAGDKTKVYKKDAKNEPWNEIYTTRVNPKPINIDDDKETYFYSNKFDNDVRTFTAKHGFMFNHARCFAKNTWVDIWKTDKEDEYSRKIEVWGYKLTIYIGEGTTGSTKVFIKGSDGKWEQCFFGCNRATETASEPQPSSMPVDNSTKTGGSPETTKEEGDVKAGVTSPEFGISQNAGEKDPANKEVGSNEGLKHGIYPELSGQSVYNEQAGPTPDGSFGHVMETGLSAEDGMKTDGHGVEISDHVMSTPGHFMTTGGPYDRDTISHGLTSPGSYSIPYDRDARAHGMTSPGSRSMPHDRYVHTHNMTAGLQAQEGMSSGRSFGPEYQYRGGSYRTLSSDYDVHPHGMPPTNRVTAPLNPVPEGDGYGSTPSGPYSHGPSGHMATGGYDMTSGGPHPEDDMMAGSHTMPTPGFGMSSPGTHGMPSSGSYSSDPSPHEMAMVQHLVDHSVLVMKAMNPLLPIFHTILMSIHMLRHLVME